ncbi:CYTH and CHAD domain-containing protein [Streptomyces meridianus]|uniref:CYTH and CHAD domain-containing protein n=1 Tax=Streptomyces meridianus TaxID=2938945 RepID=A0ABT0X0H3_9ACTN|nr:CYTH and CHAD domain-containing protein [Streptomyces meridianus]MCM2576023.1 CYTH and CHAD domain-containing protein [Streptomyces meridianus]
MADKVREIERKYDSSGGDLPDLRDIAGVATVADEGVHALDATYYDTPDERLATAGITLRRRTGGDDEGWHLKLPADAAANGDARDEIHAPLSDEVPRRLASLVRVHTRDRDLVPVMRLRTERRIRRLHDADGAVLADVAVDRVEAQRLHGGDSATTWAETEVELAGATPPAFLDGVERHLLAAGLVRADVPSKLARALERTRPRTERAGKTRAAARRKPVTAGDHVLAYVRAQADEIVRLDPAVRLEAPDSVHRMRVACRRLRSALRTYRNVLDRAATDPVITELSWLAGELGLDRDREVLSARLHEELNALPHELLIGSPRGQLRTWDNAQHADTRRHVNRVLDADRYLALLGTLDTLLDDPPLLPAASRKPRGVMRKAVLRDLDRLTVRIDRALGLPPGEERDLALHEARKAAKRTRYGAEAARPVLGKPARRMVKRMKSLQTVLGDHQDSVVAREALLGLAARTHSSGENAFTFGVLYGREEQRAAAREAELGKVWREVAGRKLRAGLGG